MTATPPLYKLMTRGTGRIVLEQRTLRWTTPPTLNDPFDVQFDMPFGVEAQRTKQEALDLIWESYTDPAMNLVGVTGNAIRRLRDINPQFSREHLDKLFEPVVDIVLRNPMDPEVFKPLRDFMSTLKILCLTDRIDCVPMWSHYAEQHQGLALQFGTPEGADSPWRVAQKITYQHAPPTILTQEELPLYLAGRIGMDYRRIMDAMTYTKGNEWAYESEWRISSGDGRKPDAPFEDVPFRADELDAVIFGCRMPDDDRADFAAIVQTRYPNAKVLVACPNPSRYLMLLKAYDEGDAGTSTAIAAGGVPAV